MKAKIVTISSNGKNYGGNKEMIDCWNVVGKYKGKIVNVATCRAYMGRSRNASVVYASIWVWTDPHLSEDGERVYFSTSTSGTGSAGGWGYHKLSAAVGDAISSAGIELYGDVYGREDKKTRAYIGGVGDSAIHDALLAIGRAVLGGRAKLTVIHN